METDWFLEEACSIMSYNTKDWKFLQHSTFIIATFLCWPIASNQQVVLQEIAT
jgi:hypothetical protein